MAIESATDTSPRIGISRLDQLWFQVAGTRCNLACKHCFISCHPGNREFGYLTLQQVVDRLHESVPLGTREYYFTGGEPFLNPEMTDMLVATLEYGPATVLTNGTVLKDAWLERIRDAEAQSLFSMEFRVSIDGFSSEQNDPIRGQGTFDRAMRGVARLVQFGFLPIITTVRTWDMSEDPRIIGGFYDLLQKHGYDRPRLKILPTLQIGAEASRTSGYCVSDRVTMEMMEGYDPSWLVCNYSRIVTDRGVHVCPILVESPDSLLEQSLSGSLVPFEIRHGACSTCYQYGAICSNAGSPYRLPTSPKSRQGRGPA
jgi:sulfatase maturation enzyme AslB (radical SAM superfamily)